MINTPYLDNRAMFEALKTQKLKPSVTAAGSVRPRCPACGRKPKLYVSMTCNQPDWWHASIRCPLPCHAVRDAGDERREIAIKEATHAWSSYAQNDQTDPRP